MTESSQQEEQEEEGLCVHELPACVYALLGEHTAEADSAAVVLLLNTPITDPCDRFAALWNTGLFPFFSSLSLLLRCHLSSSTKNT